MIVLIKTLLPIYKNGVKFRDFILADILTSFIIAFANLTVSFCLIYCDNCKKNFIQLNCHYNYMIPVVVTLPYLFRLFQCINKIYYRSSHKIQFINAIKYLSLAFYVNTGYVYSLGIAPIGIYIGVAVFTSSFALMFDLLVDWNLFHNSKYFLLRNKIIYPKWFYYYAIISNTFIRFIWILNVIKLPIRRDYIMLIINTAEVYRRTQWVMIRVENENLYNIEQYRNYLPIPILPLH